MEKSALPSSSTAQDVDPENALPEYTAIAGPSSVPAQQTIDNPVAPPQYAEAASSTSPITHNFVRRNLFSSKVLVQSAGVDRYCFAAGKDARVWIHAGASTDNPPLGYLTFPASHNAFRLYFGAGEQGKAGPGGMDENGFAFSDVKARVGYPHSGSFSFKGATSGRIKEYEWVNRDPSHDVSPVHYDLSVSGLAGGEALATLTVSRKGKGKTSVQWRKAPENELEQAFLILSAIGVITRLSKKGSYRDSDSSAGQRWFAVWWMAALSAHALGGE
ncbi:hypothetical protein Q7P35_005142 [Cladosporium inversicolor]